MEDPSYKDGLIKIQSIKVTNDIAERMVSLAETFNGKITKEEDQYQNLLQCVNKCRKVFPECTKEKITQAIERLRPTVNK